MNMCARNAVVEDPPELVEALREHSAALVAGDTASEMLWADRVRELRDALRPVDRATALRWQDEDRRRALNALVQRGQLFDWLARGDWVRAGKVLRKHRLQARTTPSGDVVLGTTSTLARLGL